MSAALVEIIKARPVHYGLLFFFVVVPVTWLLIAFLLAMKRKIKSPEKSFKFCIINELLSPVRAMGKLGKYGFDGSMSKAMRIAKKKYKVVINEKDTSDAWGIEKDNDFRENYKSIVDSDNFKKQKFHNLGLVMATKEMDSVCIRRLQFQQFLKNHPGEVEKIPIKSPCFVIGLPRTGTTWLSRCLAQDPNVHAPKLWELLRCTPEKSDIKRDPENWKELQDDLDLRRNSVKNLLAMRKDLGDSAMDHIHEVDAENHEECLWCMSDDMPVQMHMLYSDYMEDQKFLKQMTNENVSRTYAYYKKQLQLLAWQKKDNDLDNPKRFLLKSPLHLFYMKALGSVFPDAKVVWTHREPVNAVPSLGSLLKSVHQLYFEPECRDDKKLGQKLKTVTEEYLEKCEKDIVDAKLDIKHVYYGDTTKNCIETIRGIYSHFGWEFTKEYEDILRKFEVDENDKRLKMAQGKELHKYEPQEFGLTSEELKSGYFEKYLGKHCKSAFSNTLKKDGK